MAKTLSATKTLVSTKEFEGVRVVEARKKSDKRIGKVYHFVFHPSEKRVVGFMVKRPDLLLMFHRSDSFVALDGFSIEDGRIMIKDDKSATGAAAIKRLGLDWDNCVLWVGMPVMTKSQKTLGYVGSVTFDRQTGKVDSLEVETGALNDALVGKVSIPASMVRGFKRGVGQAIAPMDDKMAAAQAEAEQLGAILVDDEAAKIATDGGVAAAAGEATAVAADKARKAVDKAKPKVEEAKQATADAVDRGVHAAGKQIGKSKTMFAEFKEEFDKASGADSGSKGSDTGTVVAGSKSTASLAGSSTAASKAAGGSAKKAQPAGASSSGSKPSDAKSTTAKTGSGKGASAKKSAPGSSSASSSAGKAAGKQVAKQVKKTKGMFAAFKEEFDKASK